MAVRGTGVHVLMGSGGAPEGVLSAAAIKCLGADFQGKFLPADNAELMRCKSMNVDPNRIYSTNDLAPGENIVFSATGITDVQLGTTVPEPSTYALMIVGLGMVGAAARRRRA